MRQSRGSLFWFLFSYRGRISRIEFWVFHLTMIVLALGSLVTLGLVLELYFPVTNSLGSTGDLLVSVALVAQAVIYVVCGISVSAKRFHDRDKPGWWALIGLVPVIGLIWVAVECGCLTGSAGPNRYGPNPLGGQGEQLSDIFE